MDIELGVKAQVAARRSGHPWLEGDHLALEPGPQLFTDWRYVLPGEIGAMGPYWAEPDGTPIPLRPMGRYGPAGSIRPRTLRAQRRAQRYPHRRDYGSAGRAVAERVRPLGEGLFTAMGCTRLGSTAAPARPSVPCGTPNPATGTKYGGKRECQFDWRRRTRGCRPRTHGDIFRSFCAQLRKATKCSSAAASPTDGEARRQILEHFARERPDDIHPLGGDFRYLSGMWGAASPDGVRWTVLPGPLVIHYSDTTNVVLLRRATAALRLVRPLQRIRPPLYWPG